MLEAAAAALAQRRVERLLAGVAEGRVAEVVAEPDRLGQVLVEAERAGDRAGDPAGLQRVGEAGPVVVALGGDEDLRLVLEAAEGLRVDDPVAVALERACAAGCRAPRRGAAPGRTASPDSERNSASQARTRSSRGRPWPPRPPILAACRVLTRRRAAARARGARASRRPPARPGAAPARSAAGASASGLAIASTMKRCASSESGKEPASQLAQTTPPAAPEKPARCSASPQRAQEASSGREAGRQRQLEPEGERRLEAGRPLGAPGRRAAPGSGRAGCRRAGWARPSRAGAGPRRRRGRRRSAPGRRSAGAGSRRRWRRWSP